MLEKIERTAFGHFLYLPKQAGFTTRETTHMSLIKCGLGSSLFNIVCDTHLEDWARAQQDTAFFDNAWEHVLSSLGSQRYGEAFIRNRISETIEEFKGQPFAWWVGPSCDPYWLPNLLEEMGFKKVTTEHAMALNLNDYQSPNELPTIQIEQVSTPEHLEDFIRILEPYDASARPFYEKFTPKKLKDREKLFVGYKENIPVIIGILYHHEDTAGIFSLLTDEAQRGKGYGTQMMHYLIKEARAMSARYITLSASSDSGYRLYERLGFKPYGEFECLEWEGER